MQSIRCWLKSEGFFIYIFFHIILSISCSKEEKEFTLGEEFMESHTGIIQMDTFSVSMSTVIMDSMPTSGTGIALCGAYRDDIFGTTVCQSFFQIGIPYEPELEGGSIYDSLTLVLPFSGYYFGDTNMYQTMSIHQLEGSLETSNDYFYNTSTISYVSGPLAQITYKPYLHAMKSLNIRITDELGENLFEKILESDEAIESDESFLEYFKGIALLPEESAPCIIMGFYAYYDSILLRVHYHTQTDEDMEDGYIDFPLINSEYQFNRITSNRGNTIIRDLMHQREALPSSKANNQTFLQGGTGIMTKIQFPTLNDFQLMENRIIVNAEMILRPAESSYTMVPLPEDLILANTDKYNHYNDIIYNEDGEEATASFYLDNMYHEETCYIFDLTDYILDEFSDLYFDANHGLIVALPTEDILTKVDRVVFDAGRRETQLVIYSLYYQ